MNEDRINIIERFGKLGSWLSLCGLVSYFLLFPEGIYYCFFMGMMGIACGVLGKMNNCFKFTTLSMILGIICVGFACMAYYGLLMIFSAASDPEFSSEVTQAVTSMLSQYGLSLDLFVQAVGGL